MFRDILGDRIFHSRIMNEMTVLLSYWEISGLSCTIINKFFRRESSSGGEKLFKIRFLNNINNIIIYNNINKILKL